MILFTEQPELLMSINFIYGFTVAGYPAVLLFAGLFVILLAGGYLFFRRRISFASLLLSAAAIAWLPLFVHFAYSSARELNDTWFALFMSEREQIAWRYCRIDKNQVLGGDFCGLYTFVGEVRERVPAGSLIELADSPLRPYLIYYLYPDYGTTYEREGEYLILLHPVHAFSYEGKILYEGQGSEKRRLGAYEVVAVFSPSQAIFKKVSP